MELPGDDLVESLSKLPRLSELEQATVRPENRIAELSEDENNVLFRRVLTQGNHFVFFELLIYIYLCRTIFRIPFVHRDTIGESGEIF